MCGVNNIYYYIIPSHFKNCNVNHSLMSRTRWSDCWWSSFTTKKYSEEIVHPSTHHRVGLVLLPNTLYIYIFFYDSVFCVCKFN